MKYQLADTPFCDMKGKPCSFDVWERTKSVVSAQVAIQTAKVGSDEFIVWTRFKGLLEYDWHKGKVKKPKKQKVFQTTVDLPAGVPFNPKNKNHVKYYNKKFDEVKLSKAVLEQGKIVKDIKKGKPIKEEIVEAIESGDSSTGKDKDK